MRGALDGAPLESKMTFYGEVHVATEVIYMLSLLWTAAVEALDLLIQELETP